VENRAEVIAERHRGIAFGEGGTGDTHSGLGNAIVSTGRWIKKNSLKNRWLQLSPSCQLSPNLKTPPSASGKMGGKFVENLLVSI
jgi:hypothetical protein